MRSLGVTWIDAYCECGYQASIHLSALPGDLAVPSIKNRPQCSKCRAGRWRPDWQQYNRPKGQAQGPPRARGAGGLGPNRFLGFYGCPPRPHATRPHICLPQVDA
jgi:hypothetical protein